MQGYNIGYYIRRIRKERGICQEVLYEGLCSRSTLHRIESGEQQPGLFVASQLLQRLGLDESSFLLPLGPQDFEISNLQKEIISLNAQSRFAEALEKIARLETLVVPQDKLAQQFILRAKALAGYECDGKRCPYDYPTQRQMLMQALDMTHPNFDLEKIERCLLSIEDMKSLNQIAITYSETGERRFAIRIYEQLMKYPRNRLFNNEALLTVTPMLCYNFSRLLGRERRYEEELEIAQYGYDISLKYDKARLLGGLLLNMGCALHELGKDEESKEKLIDSYYAYRLINNKKSCALVANYAKGKYDIILE